MSIIGFMGRIFHLSYQDALERISSNPYSRPKEISNTNFSQVLADFEKKSSESKAVSSNKNISDTSDYLSNINSFQHSINSKVVSLSQPNEPDSTVTVIDDPSVNQLTVPVKITPAMAYNGPTTKAITVSKDASEYVSRMLENEIARMPKEQLALNFDKKGYMDMISASGRYHGLDPSLALAIAKAESSFNHKAVSSDGFYSKGLFQLLDSTAKEMIKRLGLSSKYKPFDPQQNTYLGVGYLRHLHNIFSTPTELAPKLKTFPANNANELEKIAVAAYNVGEGAVAEAQEKAKNSGKNPGQFDSIKRYLPLSTRDYVARVSQNKRLFDGDMG
ncbi:MAG: transglycosylase SLT domain-containing protein [Deltaproteobacteria bacterium]|nr:transglycosylase SLT domain-containing protein [Deltaproteobacteria bacterium]